MAIYTKKGDKGSTSLFDNSGAQRVRISKDSLVVDALGSVDGLNSYLGVVKTHSESEDLKKFVSDIQKDLLTIGSTVAGAKLSFPKSKTKKLETKIDELEGKLPVLKNFVVPGGSKLSAHFQFARSLSRRTERTVVSLSKPIKIKPEILRFLNRLSDLLMMLAREANAKEGIGDEIWRGRKK